MILLTLLKLDFEYDYDFLLLGISCHEKDYRLCWAINNKLGFDLKKSQELEIKEKNRKELSSYSLYSFEEIEKYREYYVIANRTNDRFLIPEQKQADYFILIKGNISRPEKDLFIKNIKEINMILAVFIINPNELKSKQNLLF